MRAFAGLVGSGKVITQEFVAGLIWTCQRRAVEVAGAFHGAPYGIRSRRANFATTEHFVTTYMACIRVSCRRIGCPPDGNTSLHARYARSRQVSMCRANETTWILPEQLR
jgi:hypothetical protein